MDHPAKTVKTHEYNSVPFHDSSIEYHRSTPADDQDLGDMEKTEDLNKANKMSTPIFLAVLALSATYVGSNLGGYFIGAAIQYIVSDLGIGNNRTWLLLVNSLAFACVAPCAGYLQDIFGRRNALIVGLLGNILGNILIGAANGFGMALAGLLIYGIGGAIGELTATAAIAELVPVRQRGLFLAINTGMNIPFIPCILYGELLSTRRSWRWCYWITLIWNVVTAVMVVLTYFRLDIQRITRDAKMATIKSIDYIGMLLLIASCAIFLIALQAGGHSHPWTSAHVLCQLIIGIVLFIVFLLWEWRGASSPVIPFRLFKGQRVVGITLLIAFIAGINYTVSLSLGPTLLENVFEPGPIKTGVYAIGPTAGLIVGATLINVLFGYFKGRARELLFVSAAILTAFIGASLVLSPTKPVTYIILSSFASLGIGGVLIPVSTVVTIACPEDLIGTAVALTAAGRTIGGAMGTAIISSILLSNGKKKIPKYIIKYAIKAGLPERDGLKFSYLFYHEDVRAALKLAGGNERVLEAAQMGMQKGNAENFHLMFYALLPFGALAALLCLALPDLRKYMTGKVVAPAKRSETRKKTGL